MVGQGELQAGPSKTHSKKKALKEELGKVEMGEDGHESDATDPDVVDLRTKFVNTVSILEAQNKALHKDAQLKENTIHNLTSQMLSMQNTYEKRFKDIEQKL